MIGRVIARVIADDPRSSTPRWKQKPYVGQGCLFRRFGQLYVVARSTRSGVWAIEVGDDFEPRGFLVPIPRRWL